MYNFNKNFGLRTSTQNNIYYYHRRKGKTAICSRSIKLIHRKWSRELWGNSFMKENNLGLHNFCPDCLLSLDKKTIDKIKFYFIVRKLKK